MKPLWAGLVILTIFAGCRPESVERDLGVRLTSPTGRYLLTATESGTRGEPPFVSLRLQDSNEKFLDKIRTPIQVGGKWALGWAPSQDVIVVSRDSFTMVYVIAEAGKLRTMECPQPEYAVIADGLLRVKYGTATNRIAEPLLSPRRQ